MLGSVWLALFSTLSPSSPNRSSLLHKGHQNSRRLPLHQPGCYSLRLVQVQVQVQAQALALALALVPVLGQGRGHRCHYRLCHWLLILPLLAAFAAPQ